MRSNEVQLRWRGAPSTLRYRPHWLPSVLVAKLRRWQVAAVFEAAAAVAREASEEATWAPIDWAGAHTRLDSGMVADRGSNQLLTMPQSIPTNVGAAPYWAHVAETCLKFAVGQFPGQVTMSNVHAALPTEVKRVQTRIYLRPIRGRSLQRFVPDYSIPGTCVPYSGLHGGGALGDASTRGTPARPMACSAHGGTCSHAAVAGGARVGERGAAAATQRRRPAGIARRPPVGP